MKKKMADSPAAEKEAARRKNLESICEFKEWVKARRTSLPFYQEYLDHIIEEIDAYLKSV